MIKYTWCPADAKTSLAASLYCNEVVDTEYVQGNKVRFESIHPTSAKQGSMHKATISIDGYAKYELNLKSSEYRVFSPRPSPPVANSPSNPIPSPIPQLAAGDSAKTVDIYQETIDTGERKKILGLETRHLILRTRVVAEPGACMPSQTSQREGWYVTGSALRTGTGYLIGSYSVAPYYRACFDNRKIHGAFPVMIPMVETDENGIRREILEVSHEPLDPKLFELPAGFKKVDQFSPEPVSWEQRMLQGVSSLSWQIESWFH